MRSFSRSLGGASSGDWGRCTGTTALYLRSNFGGVFIRINDVRTDIIKYMYMYFSVE